MVYDAIQIISHSTTVTIWGFTPEWSKRKPRKNCTYMKKMSIITYLLDRFELSVFPVKSRYGFGWYLNIFVADSAATKMLPRKIASSRLFASPL